MEIDVRCPHCDKLLLLKAFGAYQCSYCKRPFKVQPDKPPERIGG